MKIKRREKYILPEWVAYYFQTGNTDGMSAKEVRECKLWLEGRNLQFADVVNTEPDTQEPFFSWRNDFDAVPVGSNCLDVEFIFFED